MLKPPLEANLDFYRDASGVPRERLYFPT